MTLFDQCGASWQIRCMGICPLGMHPSTKLYLNRTTFRKVIDIFLFAAKTERCDKGGALRQTWSEGTCPWSMVPYAILYRNRTIFDKVMDILVFRVEKSVIEEPSWSRVPGDHVWCQQYFYPQRLSHFTLKGRLWPSRFFFLLRIYKFPFLGVL